MRSYKTYRGYRRNAAAATASLLGDKMRDHFTPEVAATPAPVKPKRTRWMPHQGEQEKLRRRPNG